MSGMCAHAQVPTSPTFGCKSRCSQACIKLSTIPSPNKPASTVSVTTKETLDKKNMMCNKHSCQQSIIPLKKKKPTIPVWAQSKTFTTSFSTCGQFNSSKKLCVLNCWQKFLKIKERKYWARIYCKASCSALINKLCRKNLAETGRCFSLGIQPMILQNIYFVQ